MSSPPSHEAVEMARRLKAYEFLFKPFSASDTLAIIKCYGRISAPVKVLIVDDSTTTRQLVQKVVQGSIFRCHVSEAADGHVALNMSAAAEFDVVFLDCNMPSLSGFDTMERLRALNQSLKVVMISADRDPVHERAAMARCVGTVQTLSQI
ncbi:MAG TPA: response regulator [Sphingomicrobium sp.]|nr:response regulator [Sphingomicrobium sp.]